MLHKLEICDISNIPYNKSIINIIKRYKIKHSLSTSGKSVNIINCNIITASKIELYEICDVIIKLCSDVSISSDGTILSLLQTHSLRLLIEHDIRLDLYEDLEEEEHDYLKKFFKINNIFYKLEEGIYKIFCQKCDLPDVIIHELIYLISFGSKAEPILDMYEKDRYSITQIKDYRRTLIGNTN